MKHNWKNIGAVTLKGPYVDTQTFESLESFVKSNAYRYLRYPLTDNNSVISGNFKTKEARETYYANRHEFDTIGRHFSLLYFSYLTDELGLIVPLWRIAEAVNATEKRAYVRHFWSCRRGHWNGWRYPKTRAELREEAGFAADEDIKEYKVKCRRRYLPTSWDDGLRSDHRNRSWKKNRRTQYKTY